MRRTFSMSLSACVACSTAVACQHDSNRDAAPTTGGSSQQAGSKGTDSSGSGGAFLGGGGSGTGGAGQEPTGVGGGGTAADGGTNSNAGATGNDGVYGPSCDGIPSDCGPTATSNCCASNVMPGGTFNRGDDSNYPATVSRFRLDTYEITVGRFAAFLSGYPDNLPVAGAGKNTNNPDDSGWDVAWNSNLPSDQAALIAAVQCQSTSQTWGQAGHLAMNCISWYEAYAFCIWDGGRLPTEAEWNYAASGGSEQRKYPWGGTSLDATHAVYAVSAVAPVGSKSPQGDGK